LADKATNDLNCFNCGEKGHFAHKCPKFWREKHKPSDKEDDEHESQNKLYVEFEVLDQQYHKDDNLDFVSMMSTAVQKKPNGGDSRPLQRASILMVKWIQ